MAGKVRGVTLASSDELLDLSTPAPTNIPRNVKELTVLVNDISLKKQALHNTFTKTQEQIDAATAEIKRNFENVYAGKPIAASASHEMQNQISAKRRAILKESSDSRYTAMREIGDLRKRVDGCSSAYVSPATMLRVSGLGTPERVNAVQDISNLPDGALPVACGEAVRSGSVPLASALIGRLESLSVQQRHNLGVDVDKFARRFVEADFVKATDMFQIAAREENDAIRMNGDLERGSSIPLQKIKAGLDAGGRRAYRSVEGSDESMNKISRGIESRLGAAPSALAREPNAKSEPDTERYFNHGLKALRKPRGVI